MYAFARGEHGFPFSAKLAFPSISEDYPLPCTQAPDPLGADRRIVRLGPTISARCQQLPTASPQ
jgi:hypothetical protein